MVSNGQRWKIGDATAPASCSPGPTWDLQNFERISRKEFIEKIELLSQSIGGQKFGSATNNHTIGVLFREQSSKWATIAEKHVKRVSEIVKSFVDRSFSILADVSSLNAIINDVVDPAMEEKTNQAKRKRAEIPTPYTKLPPISYNR